MAPPEFKPGMFEPVITIGLKPDGNTRAFHGDKEGLMDCSRSTFALAYSSASARGANLDMSRSTVSDLSKVFGQYLWVRNLANQINKVGVNQSFAREVLRDLEIPEPLIKLFNAYGHFEHDQSTHVQLDLEREFAFAVVDLAYMVRNLNLDDDEIEVRDPPNHLELSGLNLSPQGDIVSDRRMSITKYTTVLVEHLARQPIPSEEKLRYIKNVIDIATERDLQSAVRWLNRLNIIGDLPGRPVDYTIDISDYVHDALGDQDLTNGAVLNKRELLRSIRRATDVMRTITEELGIVIASTPIPKYEQGSAAQASQTIEDITYSPIPLSLADITVSAAFKVGRVLRRFLRVAPEDAGSGLQSELIRKSVRRRA